MPITPKTIKQTFTTTGPLTCTRNNKLQSGVCLGAWEIWFDVYNDVWIVFFGMKCADMSNVGFTKSLRSCSRQHISFSWECSYKKLISLISSTCHLCAVSFQFAHQVDEMLLPRIPHQKAPQTSAGRFHSIPVHRHFAPPNGLLHQRKGGLCP